MAGMRRSPGHFSLRNAPFPHRSAKIAVTSRNDPGDPSSRQRKAAPVGAPFAGRSGPPDSTASAASEHVLIVDDEPSIRLSLHRFFSRHGYRVSVARNGCEALTTLRETPRVDVVVTDLVMPDSDGRELIMQMRAEYPGMPVLVISGFPAALLPEAGPDGRPVPYLPKPFALDALLAEVRRLLDESARRRADA
jgi:CheY-like chemotaxis protein